MSSSSSPTISFYHRNSYTGFLTSFFSFSPHSYWVGQVKTLIDRTYKIRNTWHGFHRDIENLVFTMKKRFPAKIIDQNIKHYLNKACETPTVSTRVREYISRDKNSHIYEHLISSNSCKTQDCFTILHTTKNSYQLQIKEALRINWLKPTLNSQEAHDSLTLDL